MTIILILIMNSYVNGLVPCLLPRPLDKAYYWAHSWDCIEFFYSKEELYEFLDYECCEKWADFDDEMLKIWYERIFVDELDIDCKVE